MKVTKNENVLIHYKNFLLYKKWQLLFKNSFDFVHEKLYNSPTSITRIALGRNPQFSGTQAQQTSNVLAKI